LVPITWCHIEVDESVLIQGHRLRFATVDLTASHADIRDRLLQLATPE
jgi:5-methylcytosine-specific restriction enzyme subunit McrC